MGFMLDKVTLSIYYEYTNVQLISEVVIGLLLGTLHRLLAAKVELFGNCGAL